MGHELRSVCQGEIRKLLGLMGIMFAVLVAFQSLELPYNNLLSSLFSDGKIPVAEKSSLVPATPLSKSELESNITHLNSSNSSDSYPVHERPNTNRTFGAEETDPNNDLASEGNDGQDYDEEPSIDKLGDLNKNSTVEAVWNADNGPQLEKAVESRQSLDQKNDSVVDNSSEVIIEKQNNSSASGNIGHLGGDAPSPLPVSSPMDLTSNKTQLDVNISTPVQPVDSNTPSLERDQTLPSDENDKLWQSNFTKLGEDASATGVPEKSKQPDTPTPAVITVAEMNKMMLQSHASYRSMRPRWSSAVDEELLHARSQIENAPILKNNDELYAPLYRNVSMFKRSYELMEEILKVYVYKEGQKPIIHQPILKGIYASEGWFMKLLEANKKFVTKDSRKAHLFYLPFSSRMLEETLYVQNSHSHKNLIQYLKSYLDIIAAKYNFWNRTEGADHFLVACHDWAPFETKQHMAKCIRALCNSDVKEGFVFGKDVSLPETYVRQPKYPLKGLGGRPPSKRSILAFFAGNMHGYLRPILLQHWENKDPDMKIFGRIPKVKGKVDIYMHHMKSSKYCICAKGFEVNSPRVVEAIFYECVPVIISDNFVPPFFGILNWESFAVFILENDIPNLKNILLSIPEKRYRQMQMRVKKVQQHFLWHPKPEKYDLFHMILHSIWYNRVFLARAR